LIPEDKYGFPTVDIADDMLFVDGDAETLFFYATLQMVFLGILLGVFVYLWSKELFGLEAGVFSLLLYGLDPNILAHSQIIHNNWKLYAENLRDSYHATLLHTFYTTFKVNRLDMDGGITLSDRKWHHISFARRANMTEAEEYSQSKVHSASYDSALAGPGLLESWNEFDDGITHSIQTIFPNLCVQFTLNSLAIRFFAPRGVDKTELFWIYLGYEQDTEAQTQMRSCRAT
jgi:hypothetical protein